MGSKFQFLIGTVLRKNETNKIKKVQMFQFLIGTVLHVKIKENGHDNSSCFNSL